MLNNTDKKIAFIVVTTYPGAIVYYDDGTREDYNECKYYDLSGVPVIDLFNTPSKCLNAYMAMHITMPNFSSGNDNNISEFIDELIKFGIVVLRNGK